MKKITIFSIALITYLLYRFLFCYSYLPEFIIPDSYKYKGRDGIIRFKKYGISKNQYKLNKIEIKIFDYCDKKITFLKNKSKNIENYQSNFEYDEIQFELSILNSILKEKSAVYSFKKGDKKLDSKYDFEYYCFLLQHNQSLSSIFIYNIEENEIVDCIFM